MSVPFMINDLLLFITMIYNIIAIFAESNSEITSLCKGSLLWMSVLLSVFVHFYANVVAKLDTKIFIKIFNVTLFLFVDIFILSQLCSSCSGKILNTSTYIASICNFVVFAWYFCVNVYLLILEYGVNTFPSTHAMLVQYGAIPTVESV